MTVNACELWVAMIVRMISCKQDYKRVPPRASEAFAVLSIDC